VPPPTAARPPEGAARRRGSACRRAPAGSSHWIQPKESATVVLVPPPVEASTVVAAPCHACSQVALAGFSELRHRFAPFSTEGSDVVSGIPAEVRCLPSGVGKERGEKKMATYQVQTRVFVQTSCKPTNKSRKKILKKLCIYFIDYSTTKISSSNSSYVNRYKKRETSKR
jgi:hypothetical protein